MTVEELRAALVRLDKGVLMAGSHDAKRREFCALEFSHAVRGHDHADTPGDLPDLRPINDGPWASDQDRTDALLPVLAALWDWRDWPDSRKHAWTQRVALETVRRMIAELPGLPDAIRAKCRAANNLAAAWDAAGAAWAAARAAERAARAAWDAAWAAGDAAGAAARAAERAARAAWDAAWAAGDAAGAEAVLKLACRIWQEAAEETL